MTDVEYEISSLKIGALVSLPTKKQLGFTPKQQLIHSRQKVTLSMDAFVNRNFSR
jgi:hypothetical protein